MLKYGDETFCEQMSPPSVNPYERLPVNPLRLISAALAVTVVSTQAFEWPNPEGLGCEDFNWFRDLSLLGDAARPFFPFSDFDSLGNSQDPVKGGSVVTHSIAPDSSYLTIRAKLNKRDGGLYHKDAGWAGISTDLSFDQTSRMPSVIVHGCMGKNDTTWATPRFTAISFQLADLGINAERVRNITFKVRMKGINDSALHQVELPVSDLVARKDTGKHACIRPVDLVQPNRVDPSQRIAFDPSLMQQLIWEVKIADTASPEVDTSTANFALVPDRLFVNSPIELWPDCATHVVVRAEPLVSYDNGNLRLDGFAGAHRFEIRDLGGKVVASFGAASQVPIALPRGTYLLSVLGERVHSTTKFSVFDR